tara:strand:- start:102 stop:827 length:726 start_codon:yes stop_codon:yes gene_type:complete
MEFSLKNENNYKSTFNESSLNIFNSYQEIVIRYFEKYNFFFMDEQYNKYIKNKGLYGICNIFKLLLLYTKNIDVVKYHTNNAVLYFLGFVEQIANANNNYLNLNIKDAIMFIYKKTIFDIIKKDEIVNCKKTDNITKLIDIFNYGLTSTIYYDLEFSTVVKYTTYINCCKKYKDEDILYKYLKIIIIFKDILPNTKESAKILSLFIKEIQLKRNINYKTLESQISMFYCKNKIINIKELLH